MKKHLFKILLFICGPILFTSCLKDDPDSNPTVYYAYQQIPNINEFMPQRLLYAFGNEYLNFGDEPPKMEGIFVADDIMIDTVSKVPSSTWMQTPTSIPMTQYFEFYEQHKGIAKMRFLAPHGQPGAYDYYMERSSTQTTDSIMEIHKEAFVNDSISPIYFKEGKLTSDDFRTVYIMGEDPYFTVFYYDVRDIKSKAEPLNAVIFTGKLEKETIVVNDTVNNTSQTIEKPVIKDLRWGIQTMKYCQETASISQIIHFGFLPTPGDLMVIHNAADVHTGEFPTE